VGAEELARCCTRAERARVGRGKAKSGRGLGREKASLLATLGALVEAVLSSSVVCFEGCALATKSWKSIDVGLLRREGCHGAQISCWR